MKIESIFSKSNIENSSVHTNSTTSSSVSSNPNDSHAKLPKLTLDKFNGELLSWQSFWDQYSVAIHTNGSLSDIQKFNYLRSYLTETTGECINGLSLTSANYQKAVEILKERYENKQILISSYMDVLVKLPKVDNLKDIDKLRKIYNSLETSVRNLADLGVEITSYWKLLISIIFDRIPTELKLLISRKFKNNVFDLDILIEIFKQELFARERVQAIDGKKNSSYDETDSFTEHNLLNNSRKSDKRYEKKYDSPLKVRVYCGGKNHLSTRCNTIIHIETRRNILKKAGRCFLCLSKGHLKKHCKVKYSCVKCDSKDHNVSICDKINEKNHDAKERQDENSHTTQIHSNPQSILLQTAFIKVLNTEEKYFANCRVIFDSGSQRTYCTEALKDILNLKSIRSELILMKRFATEEGVLKEIDVVQICVKSKTKSTNVFIEALSIPFLCSSIQGQSIENLDISKYNYLKNLDFADKYTSDNSEKCIDILIGMDYYFNFLTGKINKRGPPGCPVAIESNFEWILSGPNGTAKKKGRFVFSSVANSHTMFADNITHKIDNDLNLKDSIHQFWKVENVGVDGHPVYENFKQTVSFDGERYVTALPFKPFPKPLPDNYTLSKHRLSILKTKLDKNEELKQEHNQVFDNYLKDGIIEKVADNDYGVVEKTHYLPHRAVVRCDKETTKVRVVFDASAKNGNEPSLNDCLYAGPCLLRQLYDILVRFRLHNIILMFDIKQVFLNVVIRGEDRDYLRFLRPIFDRTKDYHFTFSPRCVWYY